MRTSSAQIVYDGLEEEGREGHFGVGVAKKKTETGNWRSVSLLGLSGCEVEPFYVSIAALVATNCRKSCFL